MPNAAGLGTHLTIGLDNEAKFGPDVDYIEEIEYSVNNCREETFYKAIREYWPDLPDGSLKPSFCGIRPKVTHSISENLLQVQHYGTLDFL